VPTRMMNQADYWQHFAMLMVYAQFYIASPAVKEDKTALAQSEVLSLVYCAHVRWKRLREH